MAQSDYELAAHVSGLNQRTEINSIFDSILTHNSGSTAPTVTKAFMMWVDTSNATYYYLKMRNHDNTAWVTLGIYTVATKTYTSYAEDTVKLIGNQTIDGVKTFSSSPIVPTPTAGTQAVNKDYADLKVALASFIGTNQSLSESGYQKLPGGLIIQWGLVTSNNIGAGSTAYVNYNIAFTSGVGYTGIQVQGVTVNNVISVPFIIIPGDGTALARFQIYNTDADSALSVYRWFAIGY